MRKPRRPKNRRKPNPRELKPETATWSDHHAMQFWVWAALHSAQQYLASSDEAGRLFDAMFARTATKAQHDEARRVADLAKYHFVATLGVTLRILKRSQHLFPAIQPAYSKASHLLTEGASLRNMNEHFEEYVDGVGDFQEKFVRADAPRPGVTVDAISTFADESGHWLGGRLNVQTAIKELQAINDVARGIPAPSSLGIVATKALPEGDEAATQA